MTQDIGFTNNGTQQTQAGANVGFNALTAVGTQNPLPVANGVAAFNSIAAGQNTVQQGAALNNNVCRANHTLWVVAGTGCTAGIVQLLGSMDNVNWTVLTSVSTISAGTFAAYVNNSPYQYLADKISTAITGGTIAGWIGSS